MALKACKECGQQVSTEAKTCPGCGAPAPKAESGRGLKIFFGLAGVLLVYGMVAGNRPGDTASGVTPSGGALGVASTESTKPRLSAAARDSLIKEATASLSLNRDKVEKISFYQSKNRDLLKTSIEAYISIPDSSTRSVLRFYSTYTGEDWVFFESMKILVDDAVVYEGKFNRYRDITTNNSGGTVWETLDIAAGEKEQAALQKVANGKEVVVRFEGRERSHDHSVTLRERKALTEVLTAHGKLQHL